MLGKLKSMRNKSVSVNVKETEEYQLIASSKYFDKAFYLKHYPDVASAGMDPVEHYLMYGWQEERVPSEEVEKILLADTENIIKKSCINPVLYILKNGLPQKASAPVHGSAKAASSTNSFVTLPMLNVMMFTLKEYKAAHPERKLVLLTTHTLENTGAPRAIVQMATVLKELGHVPVILSMKNGPLKAVCDKSGIPVLLEPISTFEYKPLDAATVRFINSFDCIVFNTVVSMRLVNSLKSTNPFKIAWIHEGEFEFNNNSKINFKFAFHYMDEVFAGGYYAKRFVDQYMEDGRESKVLLYGIENNEEDEQAELQDAPAEQKINKKMVISVLGTFCKRKAQDVVIDALPLIPQEVMDHIEIQFVGSSRDAQMQSMVEAAAENYANVKIIKEMPLKDLLDMMRTEMDVLLCPSRDDPMPIVCTEAMRMKKIVAVSKNTGTYGYINEGENGYVLEGVNARSVCDTIVKMYENRSRNAEIGEQARKVYDENFTIDCFKENMRRIMNRCTLVHRGLWNDIL